MSSISTKDGSFKWSYDLPCKESEIVLELKVLVNDQDWMIGANHHVNLKETTKTEQIFPYFYTFFGSLTTIEKVYSKELGNFRDVIVYTPPSYNENTLKVHKNVLIMHDGQNLFNPLTSAFGTAWMCQETLNELIVEGASDEVIIMGAYNTPDRTDEYTYVYDPSEKAGGKGDLYLDWIESTLIPLAQERFRVEIKRDTLGILGSSLGGLISCYAGWTRSEVYGKVGCLSSSFWWDDQDFQNNILVNNKPSSAVPFPAIYMDSGTGEAKTCTVYTTQIHDYCLEQGFQEDEDIFQYVQPGGEHNEASWGARFDHPIKALYGPSTV